MLKALNIAVYMVFGVLAFSIEPLWKGLVLLGLMMIAQFLIGYSIALDMRDTLAKKKN